MPRERASISVSVCAAVFILMEIAAFYMLAHASDIQHIWISRSAYGVKAAVWGMGENVRNFFSLREQNERLAEENYSLNMALGAIRHAEDEENARELASGMNGYGHFTFTPARIVKASRNSQHNYIILDKGSSDGILPQSGIVTARGVVGIVDEVSEHFCYGISFMNTAINVSARIGDEGVSGPLSWTGRDRRSAVLKEIPLHYEITPGDTVWTSGFSELFPPDIPLGTAGSVKTVNGTVNDVSIRLFEDFSALRYVMIATNLGRDEINELELTEKQKQR